MTGEPMTCPDCGSLVLVDDGVIGYHTRPDNLAACDSIKMTWGTKNLVADETSVIKPIHEGVNPGQKPKPVRKPRPKK